MKAAEALTQILHKSGLTKRGLSIELGFPENAVWFYMRGNKKPSVKHAYKLVVFAEKCGLNFNLEDFLSAE